MNLEHLEELGPFSSSALYVRAGGVNREKGGNPSNPSKKRRRKRHVGVLPPGSYRLFAAIKERERARTAEEMQSVAGGICTAPKNLPAP